MPLCSTVVYVRYSPVEDYSCTAGVHVHTFVSEVSFSCKKVVYIVSHASPSAILGINM